MDILTIIPPKILDRISLILIVFINTNFQHKEGSFDSVIGQQHRGIMQWMWPGWQRHQSLLQKDHHQQVVLQLHWQTRSELLFHPVFDCVDSRPFQNKF
jgi:hypothetical protein